LIQVGIQVVADISAELATKMPAALTDADAAAITFQVATDSKPFVFLNRNVFITNLC
jgi:hypothetical protein